MLWHDKNLQGYYILSITGVITLVYHFNPWRRNQRVCRVLYILGVMCFRGIIMPINIIKNLRDSYIRMKTIVSNLTDYQNKYPCTLIEGITSNTFYKRIYLNVLKD